MTFHSIKQIKLKASQTITISEANDIWDRLTKDKKTTDRSKHSYKRISRNVIRRRKV